MTCGPTRSGLDRAFEIVAIDFLGTAAEQRHAGRRRSLDTERQSRRERVPSPLGLRLQRAPLRARDAPVVVRAASLLDRVCELVPDAQRFVGATASGEEHRATGRRRLRTSCRPIVVQNRDAARRVAERSRDAILDGPLPATTLVTPLGAIDRPPGLTHGTLGKRRRPSEQERHGGSWAGRRARNRRLGWQRHLQRRHRLPDLVGARSFAWRDEPRLVVALERRCIEMSPPSGLRRDQGLAPRYTDRQRGCARHRTRITLDLDPDARQLADVWVQPPTTSGDLGGDLMKSSLRLLEVGGAGGIGRLRTHTLPDRDRYLAPQAISSAFDRRVERMARALSLELWRIPQARHGRPHRGCMARGCAPAPSSVPRDPPTSTPQIPPRPIAASTCPALHARPQDYNRSEIIRIPRTLLTMRSMPRRRRFRIPEPTPRRRPRGSTRPR